MTLDEYQAQVMRTANRGTYPDSVPEAGRHTFDLMTWGLGLTGEAGEVADLLKKGIGHGRGLDRQKLIKELGDVLWYVAALASGIEMNLAEVAAANVAKLRARYPDGFSVEASKVRVLRYGRTPGHSYNDQPCERCDSIFGCELPVGDKR